MVELRVELPELGRKLLPVWLALVARDSPEQVFHKGDVNAFLDGIVALQEGALHELKERPMNTVGNPTLHFGVESIRKRPEPYVLNSDIKAITPALLEMAIRGQGYWKESLPHVVVEVYDGIHSCALT